MSQLVVIEFPEEHTAFAARAELAKLQKEYLIEMKDVVVVTKDDKGKVLKTSLSINDEQKLRQVIQREETTSYPVRSAVIRLGEWRRSLKIEAPKLKLEP